MLHTPAVVPPPCAAAPAPVPDPFVDPERPAALDAAALAGAGANPVLDRLARLASELLGVPIGLVSLVDGEAQHFVGLHGLGGVAGARRGTPIAQSLCQDVVARAAAVIIDDAGRDPAFADHPAHRELGVVAYAGVPLTTTDGATLGAFCAIDTAPHAWTAAQIAALHDLAAAAVAELELRLAHARLAERRAQLRLIYDGASDLMFLMRVERNADGTIAAYRCESVNAAYRAATGFTEAQLLGRTVDEFLPRAAAAHALAQYARATATGEVQRYDESVELPHGRLVVETTLTPVRDAAGRCTHLLGAARDVTARRRIEAEVALLQRVTHAVSMADDADAALLVALESLCDATGWAYGEVWLPTADGLQLELGPVWLARRPRVAAHVTFAYESRAFRFGPGEGLPGRVWATAMPVRIPDIATDPDFPRLALATRAGFRAAVGVPVLADGVVVAVLAFHGAAPHATDGSGTCLLATVAAQIGDVVRRKRAEDARTASEARYRQLFERSPGAAWVYDVATLRFLAVNPAAERLYGWSAAEFRARTLADLYPDVERAQVEAWVRETEGASLHRVERRHATRDGRRLTVLVSSEPVVHAGRDARLGLVEDVTTQRAVEAELRAREAELRGVLAASPDCIKTLDLDGHLLSINETGCRLLELTAASDVVGVPFPTLFPDDDDRVAVAAALAAARAGGRGHVQAPAPSARGTPKWWDVAVTPIPGADGAPARLLCVSREITAMKRAEEELRALSDRDELTGLLNRRGFRALADATLATGRRVGRIDALLYIDLDAFKPINDVYGHAAGDAALQAVGRVLATTVRQSDFVARLGGDEFAVYAAGLARTGEGALLVGRLQAALTAHNVAAAAAGRPWSVRMSVGLAEAQPGDTLDVLLAQADAAAYAAKRAERALAAR